MMVTGFQSRRQREFGFIIVACIFIILGCGICFFSCRYYINQILGIEPMRLAIEEIHVFLHILEFGGTYFG
jgi:hypothetical protein